MKSGLLPYCRFTVNAKHLDGKNYVYKIGICVEPTTSTNTGCAVVQSQSNASNTVVHCIGKVAKSQVARSEFNLLIIIRASMNNLALFPGLPSFCLQCEKG